MRQLSSKSVPKRTTTLSRRFRIRPFYITILCISIFAVISLVADQVARYRHGSQYGAAQRRAFEQLDITRVLKRDEECRLVHQAEDKCAFIKANCPDEEAGLFSYLSLYYCNLQKAQWLAFVVLSVWLGLLFSTIGIAASDFFCINLSTIASILGMSESMAGVTFLAFGNGSPDVFSTFAAMSSHSGSLAIGELMGAAGFITAVVAGSMALVREFKVGKKTFVRDVGFFIVAASFSMGFLADGALHLWECCVMVGFYVFYVCVVVVWHWHLGRRRRHREREAAARGQYLAMTNEEVEVVEEDEDDDDGPAGQRGRYTDGDDFNALERASGSGLDHDYASDEDEDRAVQLASEMASSMRVTRPRGTRRSTITPIRPSLVGALEFRSVLSSLQKNRGLNARPIHLRRYSDDPASFSNQYDGESPDAVPYPENVIVTLADDIDGPPRASPVSRTRAVSMNDAAAAKPTDPAAFSVANIPNIGVIAATPHFPLTLEVPGSEATSGLSIPPSPTISLSPPASDDGSQDHRPAARNRDSHVLLDEGFSGAKHVRGEILKDPDAGEGSMNDSPNLKASRPSQRPRLQIPGASSRESSSSRLSPVLPFPAYMDSPLPMSSRSSKAPSLLLPEASMTPESAYDIQDVEYPKAERSIHWWPYLYLPSPHTLALALFPTLCTWKDKSIWDKIVSVLSAPSVFLLAVTLPVVESEKQEEEKEPPAVEDRRQSITRRRSTIPVLTPDSPSSEEVPEWFLYRRATDESNHSQLSSPHLRGLGSHGAAAVAVSIENHHHHPHSHAQPPSKQNSDPRAQDTLNEDSSGSQDWNRWLVSVQIFTAPIFVVVIIWANTEERRKGLLVQMILYSLLGSLVAFALLVWTTSPMKPPKHRFLLCFLGFVVSISWISTIANEVVGVLKAFGIILGISDAILGLTIFAVGNSLGDLVADITVARLGYPVMALSACFGGPMLNILLGIGLSGMYMTITEANHHKAKHPNKKYKYKPYQIEVSGTLMISGITLLVTLAGLLIAVPYSKWMMTRKIGWGLIILWSVSTVVNLAVEISGVMDNSSPFAW